MTDEERQKCCAELRPVDELWRKLAADEIERLAALAPARPDASAGLIEAAEYAESLARASVHEDKSKCLIRFAGLLRARAAGEMGDD